MSNIPIQDQDSSRKVKEFYNNYFNEPLTFPSNDVDAVIGYFESRGFDRQASISTATVILTQAKLDLKNSATVKDSIETKNGYEKKI